MLSAEVLQNLDVFNAYYFVIISCYDGSWRMGLCFAVSFRGGEQYGAWSLEMFLPDPRFFQYFR